MHPEHLVFDEGKFSITNVKTYTVLYSEVESGQEYRAAGEPSGTLLPEIDQPIPGNNDTYNGISLRMNDSTMEADDSKWESGHEAGADIQQGNVESSRFPRRHRKPSLIFSIDALTRSRCDDEPGPRNVLKRKDAEKLRSALRSKIHALKQLDYWEKIKRPENGKALHAKISCCDGKGAEKVKQRNKKQD